MSNINLPIIILNSTITIIVISIMFGCGSPLPIPNTDFSFDKNPNQGMMIVSFSDNLYSIKEHYPATWEFHHLKERDKFKFPYQASNCGPELSALTFDERIKEIERIQNIQMIKLPHKEKVRLIEKPDWEEPEGFMSCVRYFLLDPGDYEFNEVIWHNFNAMTKLSTKPFSIKFTITPGKAVYIGNLMITVSSEYKYVIKVNDKFDRDLPLFYKRMPNIKTEYVLKMISKLE